MVVFWFQVQLIYVVLRFTKVGQFKFTQKAEGTLEAMLGILLANFNCWWLESVVQNREFEFENIEAFSKYGWMIGCQLPATHELMGDNRELEV